MAPINLTPRITSSKLNMQKFELLANPAQRNYPKNSFAQIKPSITDMTNSLATKIRKTEPTSHKMDSEKNEALLNYAMQLEQLVKEQPTNINLRTQLASVKNLLVK